MSDVVDKAVEALMALPKADRDRIAWEIIARLEDKSEWDRIVSSETSRRWLEKAAQIALKKYAVIEKSLNFSPISLPSDDVMRKDSYWNTFADLPPDVRKMAEENYRLWQANPADARLRFKQIHPASPIFSFRVGLKYRTLGVETPDQKMAWFWVGSFQQYHDIVGDG